MSDEGDSNQKAEFTTELINSANLDELSSFDTLDGSSPSATERDPTPMEDESDFVKDEPTQEAIETPPVAQEKQTGTHTHPRGEKPSADAKQGQHGTQPNGKDLLPLFLYPNDLIWKRLNDDIRKDEYYRSKRFLSFLGTVEAEIRHHWFILLSPFMTAEDQIYALGASKHPKNRKKTSSDEKQKPRMKGRSIATNYVTNTDNKDKRRADVKRETKEKKEK